MPPSSPTASAPVASATVHLSRSDVPPDAVRAGTPLETVTLRSGRVDAGIRAGGADRVRWPEADPAVFVCGPTSFVEAVIDLLADAGLDPRSVRAERFG